MRNPHICLPLNAHLASISINVYHFGAVPAGDMLQCKIYKIVSDMPNVFGITDDILVIGYNADGADHDAAVHKVLRQCGEST